MAAPNGKPMTSLQTPCVDTAYTAKKNVEVPQLEGMTMSVWGMGDWQAWTSIHWSGWSPASKVLVLYGGLMTLALAITYFRVIERFTNHSGSWHLGQTHEIHGRHGAVLHGLPCG